MDKIRGDREVFVVVNDALILMLGPESPVRFEPEFTGTQFAPSTETLYRIDVPAGMTSLATNHRQDMSSGGGNARDWTEPPGSYLEKSIVMSRRTGVRLVFDVCNRKRNRR